MSNSTSSLFAKREEAMAARLAEKKQRHQQESAYVEDSYIDFQNKSKRVGKFF